MPATTEHTAGGEEGKHGQSKIQKGPAALTATACVLDQRVHCSAACLSKIGREACPGWHITACLPELMKDRSQQISSALQVRAANAGAFKM